MTTAELLEKWREATRAAELAKRLAEMAVEASANADQSVVLSEQIARMAERTAAAADEAAATARRAADDAVRFAAQTAGPRLRTTAAVVRVTEVEEDAARNAYHDAEALARDRHQTS